jgi:hypothetical protein
MSIHRLASAPSSSSASSPSAIPSSRASPSLTFLRALVDLAACDDLDDFLDTVHSILTCELRVHAAIELWSADDTRHRRGQVDATTHTTWIGISYTMGAIRVAAPPAAGASSNTAALTAPALPAATRDALDLLAQQVAPLAERLLDRDASARRTIRDDIKALYERRIRDALIRHDWNVSAVARELRVGRTRVGHVAHRWRSRSEQLLCDKPAAAIANNNSDDKVRVNDDFGLNRSARR